MIAYRAVPFHPVPAAAVRRTLGQAQPQISPTAVRAAVTGVTVVELAFAAATAYVGIWAARKSTGFLSFLGWSVGILGAIGGLSTLGGFVAYAVKGMPLPEEKPAGAPGPGGAPVKP